MQGKVVKGKEFKKSVEVRKYQPSAKTPRGQTPVEKGKRFFLVAEGEVWGSAQLGDVHTYECPEDFELDEDRHCVGVATGRGPEVKDIQKALASGSKLYGWQLENIHWFRKEERPKSGQGTVPAFYGQEHGWVWTSSPLPMELDPLAPEGDFSKRSE